MIEDDTADAKKVKRLLICNGQFYYELKAKREELNLEVYFLLIFRTLP